VLVSVKLPDGDRKSSSVSDGEKRRSAIGGLWVGLVLAALVMALLLIFILQNPTSVQISFLAWDGALPAGVALLFAAIAGVLLVAAPGSMRIAQLRKANREMRLHQEPRGRP
jgi:uncharacterized integral membrane protein